MIHLTINAIQYKANTPEEQDLGQFTRININKLSMWDELEQGEIKQPNQMHDLGMFGKPIDAPNNAIVLIHHLKYDINRNGNRRSR